jgi:hypothetical protein
MIKLAAAKTAAKRSYYRRKLRGHRERCAFCGKGNNDK